MTSRTWCAWLLPLAAFAVACGGGDSEGSGSGSADVKPASTAQPLVYDVTTQIDMTQLSDFSEAIDATLEPLRRLKEDPAQTMLDELSAKNVPIVATLKSKIPDSLEGQFAGWFNDDARSATDALGGVNADLAAMAGKFQILSTLDMTPGQSKHTIKGLAFTRGSEKVTVDAPDLVSAIAPDPVKVDVSGPNASVGAHAFGLPIGGLTSSGLDLFNKDKLAKTGLRFVIGRIVDCGGIAKKTANRCIASLCIGHETEIKDMCDSGLDVVTDVTLFALKKLNINPLSLLSGDISILDAVTPGDGGLLSGVWKGSVNLGKGEKDLSSTLTGKRLPSLPKLP
jgi:hypothetical protein